MEGPAGGAALAALTEAWRARHPRQWRKGPPKGWGVRARLDEHGLEACLAVVAWAHDSQHRRAVLLREGDYHVGETLWRASKFPAYLAMAEAEEEQPVEYASVWHRMAAEEAAGGEVIDVDFARLEMR